MPSSSSPTAKGHDESAWSSQAQASIRRQNEQVKQLCVAMNNTETNRLTRLSNARNKKERLSLEKRFAQERKVDQERLNRLITDTNRIKTLASNGLYNGTKIDKSRRPAPIEAEEVTGLQARGGLTDNQYKFMKQMFTKFQEPIKRKGMNGPPPPRTPNLSYYRDAKINRERARVDSMRKNLLQEKKSLLTQLSSVCDQQSALIANNAWGSSRSTFSNNPPLSARSTRSSATSVYSMASMARRPEHTFTKRAERPSKVPVLF